MSTDPGVSPSADERNWAVGSHLLGLLLVYTGFGFVAPLAIYLTKGKESEFIRDHAREALNFQITMLIAGVVSAILIVVFIGALMLAVLAVAYVVLTIIAALAASKGEQYRYPFTLRLVS